MAVEAAIYNLLIQVGDDWSESFQFNHGIQLRLPATNTTTLQVFGLPVALTNGSTLTFDRAGDGSYLATPITVTLAANASLGATTITTTSNVTIPTLAVATGPARDLTGSTFAMQIRDKDYSNLLATATVSNSSPTSGIINASIARTATKALGSNCRFEQLPRNIQSYRNFSSPAQQQVYAKSYTWDLDETQASGLIVRRFQGRVFATPEATQQ